MTLPPVIRIFFAIDLPDESKKKLGQYIGALKKKSKSRGIRWTKPENLHITLQFLAEVHTEHLPQLLSNVRTHLKTHKDILHLNMSHINLYPSPYRPRVIVLEVSPQEELASLSALIGKGIQDAHYEIESRPFRGHLTLGRIKHRQGVDLGFLNDHPVPTFDNIDINEVLLFRSEPQPEGSRYTIVDRIELK